MSIFFEIQFQYNIGWSSIWPGYSSSVFLSPYTWRVKWYIGKTYFFGGGVASGIDKRNNIFYCPSMYLQFWSLGFSWIATVSVSSHHSITLWFVWWSTEEYSKEKWSWTLLSLTSLLMVNIIVRGNNINTEAHLHSPQFPWLFQNAHLCSKFNSHWQSHKVEDVVCTHYMLAHDVTHYK